MECIKKQLLFIRRVFIGVCVNIMIGLLYAYPVMLAWNFTMPLVFELPVINYWLAFGFFMLSDMLLKKST